MTIRETIQKLSLGLSSLYDENEARSIAKRYIQDKLSFSLTQLVLHMDEECSISTFEDDFRKLVDGTPVQHVTGFELFFGRVFKVNSSVLIPRPETEKLVEMIIEKSPRNARILDVGTGSGAIAVSIALNRKDSRVEAMDISEDALAVAESNAENLKAEVHFLKGDALSDFTHLGTYDVIVSNPPYIPLSEKSSMHVNVVEHDPSLALFVDDSDPLVFYRSIAGNALRMLSDGGYLMFEIFHTMGFKMEQMLQNMGFREIIIENDIFGKQRFIICRR